MANYQTGIAAEFYALSALYRLGLDANMTLGNRKAVDILAINEHDVSITIDVKGLAGKTGWPVDNVKEGKRTHFLIFICFLGTIEDLQSLPEVYVVPSLDLPQLIYQAPGGRRLVQLSKLRQAGNQYRNAWSLITELLPLER
ncbi:hypothetical protein [Spirosoma pulveris]